MYISPRLHFTIANLVYKKENQTYFSAFCYHLKEICVSFAADSGSLSDLNSISPWGLDFNPVELINVYTLGVGFINYSTT